MSVTELEYTVFPGAKDPLGGSYTPCLVSDLTSRKNKGIQEVNSTFQSISSGASRFAPFWAPKFQDYPFFHDHGISRPLKIHKTNERINKQTSNHRQLIQPNPFIYCPPFSIVTLFAVLNSQYTIR
jgi:hypothetical protein